MQGRRFTKHEVKTGGYRAQLDKSSFLRSVMPLAAQSAIPQQGTVRHSRPTTDSKLYRSIGYKWRESYTRNRLRAPKLIRHNKFFAKASLYTFAFGEGKQQALGDDSYTMPTSAEMRDNPEFGVFWEKAAKEHSGYDWIAGWILHPNAPGNPQQKLVLVVLASRGLFDVKNGRIHGKLQIAEQTIAGQLGISRDTVSRALDYWVAIGLLEIKENPGYWELDGKKVPSLTAGATWRQPSNTIFYAPGRVFNQEQAARERQRFMLASKSWQDSYWFQRAADVHAETLKEWLGTEKKISTFFVECRTRLRHVVPEALIDVLVPRGPD